MRRPYNPKSCRAGTPTQFTRLPWAMRRDLLASRGRAHKLSFFIHDFMDAGCLDCGRIDACVFMVATADGPISMCLHNAKRDEIILKPIRLTEKAAWWDPLTGRMQNTDSPGAGVVAHTRKILKGRLKKAARPAPAPADASQEGVQS